MIALCGCSAHPMGEAACPVELAADKCRFPTLHEGIEEFAREIERTRPEDLPDEAKNADGEVLFRQGWIARRVRQILEPPNVAPAPFRPCMVIGCGLPRYALLHTPPFAGPDNHHVYVQGPMPGEVTSP